MSAQAPTAEIARAFALAAEGFYAADQSAKLLRADCVRFARLIATDPALDDEAAVRAAAAIVRGAS